MADKPPEEEPGADERFQRGIANALKMPPPKKKGREPRPAPKGK